MWDTPFKLSPTLHNYSMNILIVDDSMVSRLMVRRFVEAVGEGHHQFAFSADGAHAMEVIEAGGIDVLITDLFMPEMDGYELIRAIGQTPLLHPPTIIVVTASKPDEQEWKTLNINVSAILPKPVTPMDLARALYRIEGRGSPDASGIDDGCRIQWVSGRCNVFERSGHLRFDYEVRCHRTSCTMARLGSHAHRDQADLGTLQALDPRLLKTRHYEGQQASDWEHA